MYRVLPPVLSVDITTKLDQTFNNIDPPETFGCRNLWREPETDLSPGASGLQMRRSGARRGTGSETVCSRAPSPSVCRMPVLAQRSFRRRLGAHLNR